MKRIITAVMAGIIAISMSGCATYNSAYLPLAVAEMAIKNAVEIHKTAPVKKVKKDNYVFAKALIKLGDAEYNNENYKKALGHYDDALREWDNYMVYTKIAFCLKKLGNMADARMVYKKALKMKAGEKMVKAVY